jgi:sec-independent protein translocase protein TatB
MLPDLSPAHILIVIVVALIVVGPKDLPMLLRKIGQFMGRMRGMANEFRASFDEMARQSELDELRKEVEAMRAASQAALPADFGGASDAEGAYMANWQASHAEPTDSILPGAPDMNSIMPPTTMELSAAAKAQTASKTKSASKAKASTKSEPKSASKAAPKPAPKAGKTADAPKPRAKKAKSAGDAA